MNIYYKGGVRMPATMIQSDDVTIFSLDNGEQYTVGVKEIENWADNGLKEVSEDDFLTFVEGHQDKFSDKTRTRLSSIAEKANYNKVVEALKRNIINMEFQIGVDVDSVKEINTIRDELKRFLVNDKVMGAEKNISIPTQKSMDGFVDVGITLIPQIRYSSERPYNISNQIEKFIKQCQRKGQKVSFIDGSIKKHFRGKEI